MTTKSERNAAEIKRVEERIAELNAHLRELKLKQTVLEDEEIIKAVRERCGGPGELRDLLASLGADGLRGIRTSAAEKEGGQDEE